MDEEIIDAQGETLRMINQKRGHKNSCIHNETNGEQYMNPVRALGKQYVHKKICKSWTVYVKKIEKGGRQDTKNNDISKSLKLAAIKLAYPDIKRESI